MIILKEKLVKNKQIEYYDNIYSSFIHSDEEIEQCNSINQNVIISGLTKPIYYLIFKSYYQIEDSEKNIDEYRKNYLYNLACHPKLINDKISIVDFKIYIFNILQHIDQEKKLIF